MQLLTYLDATTKAEDAIPAGVFYFNLIEPYLKCSKNLTDEEIEKEIKKQFKMKGLILADVKIIRMMDKTLENGYSDSVPVYIDKNGEISNNSSTITKEEFSLLQKYTMRLLKQISKEILSGNINIKPFYNTKTKKTPCSYCEYKAICGFNTKLAKNDYMYINFDSKEEVLESIKKGRIEVKNLSNDVVIHVENDIAYLQYKKLLEYDDIIKHAYTLKKGNMDFSLHGSIENYHDIVIENYKKICGKLGLNYINVVRPYQTHTNNVQSIYGKINKDDIDIALDELKDIDGVITDKKEIILSTLNADCILFLIFDPKNKVIASVHSRWERGL